MRAVYSKTTKELQTSASLHGMMGKQILMNTPTTYPTDLILHGHFYQPPRENPRTDIVEVQDSAAPYRDWNERIWASCYRANAHSRYLNSTGQIESISNNYAHISFNFGATLLSWMEENHPATMEAIIQADKDSVKRLGHGNAIAQGFNHTILPLDDPEDARIQVEWGLEAFRTWFGRDSEGLWCPEAAINPAVIDILSSCGVKFVILSPWQCKSVEDSHGDMIDLSGKPAPYDEPFILTGEKGGTVSAFFYHPGLAGGISFGHLLRDADNLYNQLLSIKASDNTRLIHTATDGEIYGHHEPFGDMALCALIKKVESRSDFTFTNYATYLANHPAKRHAVLLPGEDDKGTSWSCVHGVSRWYKDCGCHTGGEEGWNQKWRLPLRTAFRTMHAKVMELCQETVGRVFGEGVDLHHILSHFGPVAAKQMTMDAFLDQLNETHPFDEANRQELAGMFVCYMFSMYSFTSCGWFFSDLGGIEPRQNIAYALMSVSLYQELTGEAVLPSFLIDLQQAKCNRPQDGNGMTIAAKEWMQLSGMTEATLFFHLAARFGDGEKRYGNYLLESADGPAFLLYDTELLTHWNAYVEDKSPQGSGIINLVVTITDRMGKKISQQTVTNASIPQSMFIYFNKKVGMDFATLPYEDIMRIADEIQKFGYFADDSPYPMDPLVEVQTMGLAFNALVSIFLRYRQDNWMEVKEAFFRLTRFVSHSRRAVDKERLAALVNFGISVITQVLMGRNNTIDDEFAVTLKEFLSMVRAEGVQPDLTQLQEVIFPALCGTCSEEVRNLGYDLNFAPTLERAQG
jgi:hypothetical protein